MPDANQQGLFGIRISSKLQIFENEHHHSPQYADKTTERRAHWYFIYAVLNVTRTQTCSRKRHDDNVRQTVQIIQLVLQYM